MTNESAYRAAIVAYIRAAAQPPDKYSHQPRLYELATRLGYNQSYDDEVLFAAVWLHDLGVFIGHRPADPAELASWDNVAYACASVPPLLERFGFPSVKIPAVVEAIEDHLPTRQPRSLEAALLRDADILEQLGAVGILRMVSKVGRDTRYPTFASVVAVLQQNLASLPAQLRLPAAQHLASARVQHLQSFLDALAAEAPGSML